MAKCKRPILLVPDVDVTVTQGYPSLFLQQHPYHAFGRDEVFQIGELCLYNAQGAIAPVLQLKAKQIPPCN